MRLPLPKNLIIALTTLALIGAGAFLISNFDFGSNQGPIPKIVQTANGTFKIAHAKDLQVEWGTSNDPSTISFRARNSSLQLQIPLKKVEWTKKNGKLRADYGPYAFIYSLIGNKREATGIKEEIIIKKRTAAKAQFKFPLSSDNLKLREKEDTWRFYNQQGEEVFYIPKPYMVDAAGNRSEKVKIEFSKSSRVAAGLAPAQTDEGDRSDPSDGPRGRSYIIIKPSQEWLRSSKRKYPVTIDPTLKLSILDVHSHPQTGDTWKVRFETKGQGDLKIIPTDQATIEDDVFKGLYCNGKKREPQILEGPARNASHSDAGGDVIYYPDWRCLGTAKVVHYTKKAGEHTLKFKFRGEVKYAYNNPNDADWTLYDFTSTSTKTAFEKGGALPSSPSDYDNKATFDDYNNIANSGGNRWQTDLATTTDHYNSQIYNFTIEEATSSLGSIDITWEGYGTSSSNTIYLKAYNYANATWTDITSLTSATTNDQTLRGAVSGNVLDYLSTNATFTVMTAAKTPTSDFTCGNDVTFTYNGSQVTYGTVNYAGHCWLDRNLGATTTATAVDDSSAYGDLFQWGRCDDGHQERTSPTYLGPVSTFTCSGGNAWDGDFVTVGSSPYDWVSPQDDSLWATSTNKNDPCPKGWRVPTESEWGDATSTGGWANNTDAVNSALKLPSAGYRSYSGGSPGGVGSYGYYWSSTVDGTDARYLLFYSSYVGIISSYRARGFSVRCLRDSGGAAAPSPLNTDYIKVKPNPSQPTPACPKTSA